MRETEERFTKKMDDLFSNGTNGMTLDDATTKLDNIQNDGLNEARCINANMISLI